jgi:archaetidylinositol phosphate synthase
VVSATSLLRRSRKQRPRPEYVCELVFRPLAHLLVLPLLALRVPPPAVLLVGAGAGMAAAVEIARGELLQAALLLQLKTVLDNADGQLARLARQVTALGRYLDTESDLVVNAALLAALAYHTGQVGLAAAAFVVLTLVLSADFNLERLYRRERGEAVDEPQGAPRLLRLLYDGVFAPQDRLLEGLVEAQLRRLGADAALRRVYHDRGTLSLLANLGLSTQLAVLGICLAAGVPSLYLWIVLGCGGVVPLLFARRELLVRRALPR